MLPDLFAAFRRAYPEIVLDVVVSNTALNLSKRDADVALRATDRPPDALIGRRVAGIAWAVFGAASRADTVSDPIAEARHYDWIGFGDNLANMKVAKWLREHAGTERIVYKVNTVLGMAEAAAAGIGLAMLPCFIGGMTPGLARLSATDPELETGLWLLTHADLRQTARVRAFMDFAGVEIGKRRRAIEGAIQ
jgi:DNA-binding transcriptional LysR family regulator